MEQRDNAEVCGITAAWQAQRVQQTSRRDIQLAGLAARQASCLQPAFILLFPRCSSVQKFPLFLDSHCYEQSSLKTNPCCKKGIGVGIAELWMAAWCRAGQLCDTHMLALFCALLTAMAMGAAAEHLNAPSVKL